MAKQDATKVLWKVQYRLDRKHKWKQHATYETRRVARREAKCFDVIDCTTLEPVPLFTRVVRHVRGQKCARVK